MNDDRKLPKVARVHESTVSKAQKHAEEAGKRMAKRSTRKGRRSSPVREVKVDPRVWKEAMLLAGGDATRIKVIDATNVIVENRSKRK